MNRATINNHYLDFIQRGSLISLVNDNHMDEILRKVWGRYAMDWLYTIDCTQLTKKMQIGTFQIITMSQGTAFPARLHVHLASAYTRMQSLLSTWNAFGSLWTNRVPCKYSDQFALMCRLTWVFAESTGSLVGKAVPRLSYVIMTQ